MSSEVFDDLGGLRDLPPSYNGAGHRTCPTCGAQPKKPCTFVNALGKTITRHLPCLARIVSKETA